MMKSLQETELFYANVVPVSVIVTCSS